MLQDQGRTQPSLFLTLYTTQSKIATHYSRDHAAEQNDVFLPYGIHDREACSSVHQGLWSPETDGI